MPIKVLFLLLGIVAGTANADSYDGQPSLSANLSWQFGGKQTYQPALGLTARYGLASGVGATMQLADIRWQANKRGQRRFNASLVGVPMVVDSAPANVTGVGVAKGIGIGTVVLLAVGAALVSAAFKEFPEVLAEGFRCSTQPDCPDSDGDSEDPNNEDDSSNGNGLPGV
jgi:hypothetical protein